MSVILRFIVRDAQMYHNVSVQQQRYVKRWLYPTLKELQRRKDRMPAAPPNKRSNYLEWNYAAELFAFSNRLGEQISSDLLREAFTNKSYIKKTQEEQEKLGITEPLALSHNETLVKEGRILMSEYIMGFLRHTLKRLPEEGVRALHDFLLSEEILAHSSRLIGTKDLILCSDEPEPCPATHADCMCAVIGALLRSSGPEKASLLVRDIILTQLAERDIADLWSPPDPWAALEGILLNEGRALPEARLAFEAGSGTLLEAYCVAIFSDKQMIGKGFGETINIAKEMAAIDSLRKMFGITDNMPTLPFQPNCGPSLSELKPALKAPNQSLENWKEVKLKNVVLQE